MSQRLNIIKYLNNISIFVDEKNNIDNLILAFVHKSFTADYNKDNFLNNERLEFLGDGILGAIINKLLYINHPNLSESKLTLYKIAFVREEMLAEVARDISLGEHIFVSKGEERMKGRDKNSILSDSIEALIGAIFLDFGFEFAFKFVEKYIYMKFDKINMDPIKSYKTMIQELIQKNYRLIPQYVDKEREVSNSGNVIIYKSEIIVGDKIISEGYGTSKKKAQENSAKLYFLKTNNEFDVNGYNN